MTLSVNKPNLDNLAIDTWKCAERLRGKFKTYEYQIVILKYKKMEIGPDRGKKSK